MKFRFIGDPNDNFSGPDEIELMGHKFSRDEWTEVTDDSVAESLEGHSHFDVAYSDVELATDGSPVTDLPKRRGWPKGKPRGPRKHDENAK